MDKMDAIFGNFRKIATKYVADDFFRPHRNRFCQKFKVKASVNLRLRVFWGRPLNSLLREITKKTMSASVSTAVRSKTTVGSSPI